MGAGGGPPGGGGAPPPAGGAGGRGPPPAGGGGDRGAAAGARLAGVWDDARRASIRAHLAAVDRSQGAARFDAAAAVLDPYARDWIALQVDACRAGRVPGAREGLYDRRVACLERRRAQLDAVASRLATSDGARAVDDAVTATHQVEDLAACSDADALLAETPPPDPAVRAQVTALRAEIDSAENARIAGQFDREPARSIALVERARRLGHAPTLAQALAYRARIQATRLETRDEITTLRELIDVAARAHDDRLAADTWMPLLAMLAAIGKPTEAIDLFPAASAAVVRAGDDPRRKATLLYREGEALTATDRIDEGIADLERAQTMLVKLGAEKRGSPLQPLLSDVNLDLGDAYHSKPDNALAVEHYQRAIVLSEQAFGPDNAEESFALNNLAQALQFEGKYAEALAAAEHTVRVRAAHDGESLGLVSSLGTVAAELRLLGRPRESLAPLQRALKIAQSDPAATPASVADTLFTLANTEADLHDDDAALLHYDAAIANYEKAPAGTKNINLANALTDRAEFYAARGRCGDAVPELERAASLYVSWRGADYYWALESLQYLGKCQLVLGHPARAIAPLERAVALHVPDDLQETYDLARFYLGRARLESGRDPKGGLALARAARASLAALKSDQLPAIDAWLAKHR